MEPTIFGTVFRGRLRRFFPSVRMTYFSRIKEFITMNLNYSLQNQYDTVFPLFGAIDPGMGTNPVFVAFFVANGYLVHGLSIGKTTGDDTTYQELRHGKSSCFTNFGHYR